MSDIAGRANAWADAATHETRTDTEVDLLDGLPNLGYTPARAHRKAKPDSGFTNQNLKAITPGLKSAFGVPDTDLSLSLGQARGNSFNAGLGWFHEGSEGRHLKFSLLGQQSLDSNFNREVLASIQSELMTVQLGQELNIHGEVATAVNGNSAGALGEATGFRVFLKKPQEERLGYQIGLSQFGADFRPNGGTVQAGTRTVEADFKYAFDTGAALTGSMDYILRGQQAKSQCTFRSHTALSGYTVKFISAAFETSSLRRSNCAGKQLRRLDEWKLSLTDNDWDSGDLRMTFSGSNARLPATGKELAERMIQLRSRHEIMLGGHSASFGPTVSLHVEEDTEIERTLKTGILLGVKTRAQRINLRMDYEAFGGALDYKDDVLKVDISYELDLGA